MTVDDSLARLTFEDLLQKWAGSSVATFLEKAKCSGWLLSGPTHGSRLAVKKGGVFVSVFAIGGEFSRAGRSCGDLPRHENRSLDVALGWLDERGES